MKSTTALFLWLLITLTACGGGSNRHKVHDEEFVASSPTAINIQDLSDSRIFPETTAVKSTITKDGKPVYTSMTAYPPQEGTPLSLPPGSPLDTGMLSVFSQQAIDELKLSPGRYVFKTWAADVNDQWVETANFTFTIQPPWWHFVVCILVFLLSIWSYNQWRTYALRKRSRELETLVNQRTEELRLAKVAAEAANEAKSSFLSTISHELRTPLTSIIGFSKLNHKYLGQSLPALDAQDAKTQKKLQKIGMNLNVVISESERILSLINGLLDLAKIESGAMEWKIEETNVTQIIEKAICATTPLFDQRPELELIREIPENLPLISADHDQIIQVLINLLSNAVKFTDAGTVRITAEISPSDLPAEDWAEVGEDWREGIFRSYTGKKMDFANKSHKMKSSFVSELGEILPPPLSNDGDMSRELIISVQDTGAGIPHQYLDQIFEKFQQVDQDQPGKPKGTGLGLPICKEIVEHHGGRIWVNSLPGHGSTFAFSLPID